MDFRDTFSGALFGILLIWGPIDHTWPAWLAIRLGYLILLPLTSWLLLKWVWQYFQPKIETEDILERVLSSIICLTLWTFAVFAATSTTHWENTKWIQTRDGAEPVGDDILVKGPNLGVAFMIAAVAVWVLWVGVIKKKAKVADKD